MVRPASIAAMEKTVFAMLVTEVKYNARVPMRKPIVLKITKATTTSIANRARLRAVRCRGANVSIIAKIGSPTAARNTMYDPNDSDRALNGYGRA